jgi:hypothetical protein
VKAFTIRMLWLAAFTATVTVAWLIVRPLW